MSQLDWLKWRQGGIGASDAGVVLKRFPFGKTPRMLYREKIAENPAQFETEAMAYGKKHEEQAIQWFEKKLGKLLFRQVRAENPLVPWMRATFDAIDGFNEILLEVKVPFNLFNHEKVKESLQVPEIYYPQCQHQLAVKGMHGMYFLSFNARDPNDSIILEVPRDDGFIAKMIPEHEKFWNCVQTRTLPEATDWDRDCLLMEDDAFWQMATAKYAEAKEWAEKADYWRKELIKYADGRECEGNGFRLTKDACEGFVDYKSIPGLPENLTPYRKPGFTKWTLRAINRI